MNRSDPLGRSLMVASALIWLAVIGVSVAAIVALVGLGSGHGGETPADSHTPWGLYAVIGISAVIILGAVPLLLRARRTATPEPPRRQPTPAVARPVEAPTERLRVFGSVAGRRQSAPARYAGGPSPELVDRTLLRFTGAMAAAIGAATLAIAVGTYCMAARADTGAWAALVIAGIITAAMPVIPWWQLRELRA